MSRFICRLRGHQWTDWYECLRRMLFRRDCERCRASEFDDRAMQTFNLADDPMERR